LPSTALPYDLYRAASHNKGFAMYMELFAVQIVARQSAVFPSERTVVFIRSSTADREKVREEKEVPLLRMYSINAAVHARSRSSSSSIGL
jgi:hypothetical protein